jgi:hypothetical protein
MTKLIAVDSVVHYSYYDGTFLLINKTKTVSEFSHMVLRRFEV